jgi:hypothetical protein
MAPTVTIHNPIHNSLHQVASESHCTQECALRCLFFVAIILRVEVHGRADIAMPQHTLHRLRIDLSLVHEPGAY